MRIAILGGGGFIGSAIADRLLSENYSLRIFERPCVAPYRQFSDDESVEWVAGDFANSKDVSETIKGVDAVVHLVSTTLPKSSNDDPIYDVQTNLVPTLQLLNAMVAHGVRRIVFLSSGGTVYGTPCYVPIDERHPTNPTVSYGIVKLAIEKYLQMYGRLYGLEPLILRVTNPYGERQRLAAAQGAVGVFLQRALRRAPIEIWGDGTITRDYLHVSDVANAVAHALAYSGPSRVFNISSGYGISLNELLNSIETVLGLPTHRRYLEARTFDVSVNVLSNKLARQELDWTPKVSLNDGLKRTAAWLKSVRACD